MTHYTQKAYYNRRATANVYKVGDRVMWLDKKKLGGASVWSLTEFGLALGKLSNI